MNEQTHTSSAELEACRQALAEALEQQRAISEVLAVISSTPTALDEVLPALLERALPLVGADAGLISRDIAVADDVRRSQVTFYPPDPMRGRVFEGQVDPRSRLLSNAARRSDQPVQFWGTAEAWAEQFPDVQDVDRPQCRIALVLRRQGTAIGNLHATRYAPVPFTDPQIALLQTFANQAVIAIENARLFDEVQSRTRELEERNTALTEALERQRATSEVLEVISRSPSDLPAVLETIGRSAMQLCQAERVTLFRVEDGQSIGAYRYNPGPDWDELVGVARPLQPGSMISTAVLERRTVEFFGTPEDLAREFPRAPGQTGDWAHEARLAVPLLAGAEPLGAFVVIRSDRRFAPSEVALIETFADQAVIAMENARLFADLNESLEHQRATGEVLEVISRAPADLQAVVDAIVTRAAALTGSERAGLILVQGADTHTVSSLQDGQFEADARLASPRVGAGQLTAETIHAAAVRERRTVMVHGGPDAIIAQYPGMRPIQDATRARGFPLSGSLVQVPLLRDGTVFGLLGVRRTSPAAYTPAQIALLETFADQAVVAMENARLFDELQARTREVEERNAQLTETLEYQQATNEVLELISRAPTDLQAVLDAIVERASRLLASPNASVAFFHGTSRHGVSTIDNGRLRPDMRLTTPLIDEGMLAPGSIAAVVAREGRAVAVAGGAAAIRAQFPLVAQTHERIRAEGRQPSGSMVSVPLGRTGVVFGSLTVGRPAPDPYTAAQVTLLETFAGQAVVAMENARLFEELQQSLEQRTATAEVLGIISRSPTDLDAVFEAIAERAARLCDAATHAIWLRDGDEIVLVAASNTLKPGERRSLSTGMVVTTAIEEARTIHLTDLAGPEGEAFPAAQAELVPQGRRAHLTVPLLREGVAIGSFGLGRTEPVPFTDQQVALIETFADQAVIAIENARLFDELQARNREVTEALEQQTAMAEVLRVIASAPTDLQQVLETILTTAHRLVDVSDGALYLYDGELLRPAAAAGPRGSAATLARLRTQQAQTPLRPRHGRVTEVAALERRTIHVPDVTADPRFAPHFDRPLDGGEPVRTALAVPLLRADQLQGVIVFLRRNPQPFTDEQIGLVQTFADQAVIAIENARLFEEIQSRTRELEAASRAKSEFLSRMSHELRTPLNAIIGFAEIMEMDPVTTARQHERVHHILQGGRHLLGLINEVLDLTRIEAGRLSLSPEPVPLDAVVQEVLDLEAPLASDAEVTLDLEDPDVFRVAVQADRQRLRQIVLNLVANAIKYNRPGGRAILAAGPGTEGRIRLTVRDTGRGIPADQLDRLFSPFERLGADATAVEGTGLGLAIARGLVEAMGGAIGVESVEGEGSMFWVELPAATASIALPDAEEFSGAGTDGQAGVTATLLYIEDNQPNVELVRHILRFRPGVTLLTAPDGASGVRIARRYQPDVVLLDLNLPDLQGDEVLARLRADERTAAIPVVMISADATPRQIERLLAAGARAYLTKPLDVRRLLEIVDGLAATAGGTWEAATIRERKRRRPHE